MSNRADNLIAAAEADVMTVRTITREDGSTIQFPKGYGIANDGPFHVHVVPVQQRTRIMRSHYRVTFSLRNASGELKRVNKAAFMVAIAAAEVANA
jgi:hypothetical protein